MNWTIYFIGDYFSKNQNIMMVSIQICFLLNRIKLRYPRILLVLIW